MPFNLGGLEWVVILLIVVVLFGVGRVSKIFGELGSGIRAFKEGIKGPEEEEKKSSVDTKDTNNDDKPS